jgi:hypothetical protein
MERSEGAGVVAGELVERDAASDPLVERVVGFLEFVSRQDFATVISATKRRNPPLPAKSRCSQRSEARRPVSATISGWKIAGRITFVARGRRVALARATIRRTTSRCEANSRCSYHFR